MATILSPATLSMSSPARGMLFGRQQAALRALVVAVDLGLSLHRLATQDPTTTNQKTD